MSLRINNEAPNFTAETTEGTITFHDWIGDGWAILFSHPKDFTPVCTTELGAVAGLKPEFEKPTLKSGSKGGSVRLRIDDRITCPREGCGAQATVRRGTKPTGGRFGDWIVICDDGHTSWEPENRSQDSTPAA